MTNESTSTETGKNGSSLKDVLAPIAAIVALLAFAWFVNYMLGLTKAQEAEWTRAVYLFTGVEAIAFAAAGFFFGREIHRERAERAEEDADEARDQANDARARGTDAEKRATEAETKGKALAAAIRSKTAGQRSKAGPYGALGGGEAVQVTQADFEELETLADQLFL